MAYIGRIPQVGNYFTLDAITTSATDTFNLLKGGVAYVPETAYHLIVSLNGVIQAPITAYTVSGAKNRLNHRFPLFGTTAAHGLFHA